MSLDELFLIPEAKSNVLVAVSVADTSNAIFTPSKSSRSGMVVREV